jgi:hypothetical protein
MAIEKGVYQAPEGLDDFEDMMEEGPDMSVTVVNPEMVTMDDGSVEITSSTRRRYGRQRDGAF